MKRFYTTLSFILLSSFSFAQWQEMGSIPFFDDHSNGYAVNGKAYVLQGTPVVTENGTRQNRLWEYDPIMDEWAILGYAPGPGRSISIGEEMDGKYYFGFGYSEDAALSDVWVFDPVDTSFTELTPCPCIGRSHPAFVAHLGKIYMGSGSGPDGDLNDWWVYDIENDTWAQKENIPGAIRHHPFQFGLDNGIFVGGGHEDNWARFDIITEEWTAISDTPKGRVAGTQFSYGDHGFVLSGNDRQHDAIPENEFFMMYDQEQDIWLELPAHPGNDRWACSNFILDDELYLFGGIQRGVNDSLMWKFDLNELDCLPPQGLADFQTTDVSSQLFWVSQNTSVSDTLYWRELGTEEWNAVPDAQAIYQLNGLSACTEYEFYVVSACEEKTSLLSEVHVFESDGCCTNPALEIVELTETSCTINWESILAADSYQLRYKALDAEDWIMDESVDETFTLPNLESCTQYEFQIQSQCSIADIEYSESFIITTKGCGPCLDIEYCPAPDVYQAQFAFIDYVRIDNYENASGSDSGYGNFGSIDAPEVQIGGTMTLEIRPGYTDFDSWVIIGVWIDFNGDGDFVDSELVFDDTFVESQVQTVINIPETTNAGIGRMRIIADWLSLGNACEQPESSDGEVEDYCIHFVPISSTGSPVEDAKIRVFPNPVDDQLQIQWHRDVPVHEIIIYNAIGQRTTQIPTQGMDEIRVTSKTLPNESGVYWLEFIDAQNNRLASRKFVRS